MLLANSGTMAELRLEDPALRAPQPQPLPTLVPETRTAAVAPARDAVHDTVVEAERPTAFSQLPSDRPLEARLSRATPIHVVGLGDLPADTAGLQTRLLRLVRAQGVGEVTRLLAEARGTAHTLSKTLLRNGRSDAHPSEIVRRVEVMEALLPAVRAERDAVQVNLQPHVLTEAHAILDASEARVAVLTRQYFDSAGFDRESALSSLRQDAQTLLRARDAALSAEGPAQAEARATYAAIHRQVSARHPLLSSFDLGTPEVDRLQDLASAFEPDEYEATPRRPDVPLRAMLEGMRSSIHEMRAELDADPTVVWRLPGVVDATLIRHGVPAHGMVTAHAHDVIRDQAKGDATYRTFVSIVAMGLGVAAALPSGGASLTVASAAATVVDGYQLYLSVEDHLLFRAASGTALDRRNALSDQVPSATQLSFEVLATATGGAGTLAAIRESAFTRLLAERGPAGDMARGLEQRLGGARAATFVDAVGPEQADLLFRDLEPETWAALARLDADHLAAATQALGPDGFRVLEQGLGPQEAGAWIAGVSEDAWRAISATPVDPQDILHVANQLDSADVGFLAKHIKGQGLAALVRPRESGTLAATRLTGLRSAGAGSLDVRDPLAEAMYDEIRAMSDDIDRIAVNTGIPRRVVASVREHLFLDVHELAVGADTVVSSRFTALREVAVLWNKAREGALSTDEGLEFERLIAHEYLERGLMKNGVPYRSSHPGYWDDDGVPWPCPEHFGAHDLAPLVDPTRSLYAHWPLLGMPAPEVP